ncbi:hypothetical protein H5410_027371 [Solanum commersonii]|uniref:Uncharacterized protein n=1 Tax=Solanum commersonii TaxID=4109 RepID=A0A9J5Z1T6_SOLCO|nr:hypothetical protein H5410_027371 [Solanum commersonii]
MQTRGRNTLIIGQNDEALRRYIDQLSDDQDNVAAQPYLEKLIDNHNNSVDQAHDGEANKLNSSVGGTAVHLIDESGNTLVPSDESGENTGGYTTLESTTNFTYF